MDWSSNLGDGKRFSFVHTCPDLSRVQPSLLYNGFKVSIAGVNRPGRGVDYPTQFNAEVVHGWRNSSVSPMSFIAMLCEDTFAFDIVLFTAAYELHSNERRSNDENVAGTGKRYNF